MADDTEPPERDSRSAAALRTFLIADIRGYTKYTRTFGDEAAGELVATFAELTAQAVESCGGEVVELRGDEALCTFVSARQAIRAAVALQRLFRVPDAPREPFPLGVGIGIDAGEAVAVAGGYRGAALNTAARLCSAAKPGQVLVMATVERLAGPTAGVNYVPQRPIAAKGIDAPLSAFEVFPVEPIPPPPIDVTTGPRRGFRSRALVAAAAALVAAALGAAVLHARGHGTARVEQVVARPDSVAVIDPRSNRVVKDVHVAVDGYPPKITAGAGFVWTYGTTSKTLFQIDPKNLKVSRIGLGVTPTDVTIGFGQVWVAAGWDKRLVSINAQSTDLPPTTLNLPGGSPGTTVAIGRHVVWVALASCVCNDLYGVDPAGTKIIDHPRGLATEVAADQSSLWIEEYLHPTSIAEIEPTRSGVIMGTQESFPPPGYLAVGFNYAWYAAGIRLWRITKAPVSKDDSVPLPNTARGIALGGGLVWVATDSGVVGVDPESDRIVHRIPLRYQPSGIAYFDSRIWVPIPPQA